MNIPYCLTCHAAAALALTNDQLHEIRTLLVQLEFACILIDLVDFVVAAAQLGKALKTHLGCEGNA